MVCVEGDFQLSSGCWGTVSSSSTFLPPADVNEYLCLLMPAILAHYLATGIPLIVKERYRR